MELETMSNLGKYTLVFLLAFMLFTVSYITDNSLMHGLIITKWLWFALMALLLGAITVTYMLLEPVNPNITRSDTAVILLLAWLFIRTQFSGHCTANFLFYMFPVITIWLFIRLFIVDRKTTNLTILAFLAIISTEAVYGLLQLYGFLPSFHSMYNITGTFHNPGPFSGFLVSGLPIALGISISPLMVFHEGEKDYSLTLPFIHKVVKLPDYNKLVKYFAQIVLVLIILVLPAARSRAAWLGGIAGSIYVLWAFRVSLKIPSRISIISQRLSTLQKRLVIGVGILLMAIAFAGLYKYKQGSADGRLLMWQVSWEMIKDKPLIGHGPCGFEAGFGNYQAEWFRSGEGTPEQELVAGTPDAPFNEFIRIWVEYGTVGILLILIILFSVLIPNMKIPGFRFKTQNLKPKNRNPKPATSNTALVTGGLLSIIVFSLFSYPVDVAPIVIQFVILSAMIVNTKGQTQNPKPGTLNPKLKTRNSEPRTRNLKPLTYVTALVILLLTLFQTKELTNRYYGYKHWKDAYQLYQYQIYDNAVDKYHKAINLIPGNGMLLQMYGKCLAMGSKWHEAKKVLEEAKTLRSDPILLTTLGDIHKELKQFNEAEQDYWQAWYMVPHKLYPKYLLAKLYNETGQTQKAVDMANDILNKKIKIPSKAIEEIKEEMRKIVSSGQ